MDLEYYKGKYCFQLLMWNLPFELKGSVVVAQYPKAKRLRWAVNLHEYSNLQSKAENYFLRS